MLLMERTASKQVWDTFSGKKRAEEDFLDCGSKKVSYLCRMCPEDPPSSCPLWLFVVQWGCTCGSQTSVVSRSHCQQTHLWDEVPVQENKCSLFTNKQNQFSVSASLHLLRFIYQHFEDRYSPSQRLFHGVHTCVRLCFEGRWGVDLPMYGVMWLDSITVNLVLLLSSCHCVKTNNHCQVQLSRQRNLRNMFCACICRAKSITATSTWSVPSASCWWMTSKKYFVSAESLFDGKPAPHYTNGKSKRAKSWRCEGFTFCCQKYLHRILHNKAVNSSEVWHELN